MQKYYVVERFLIEATQDESPEGIKQVYLRSEADAEIAKLKEAIAKMIAPYPVEQSDGDRIQEIWKIGRDVLFEEPVRSL